MDSLHILYRSQNLKQHKAVLIYFIMLIAFLSSEQHNEKTRNSIALNLYRCFNITDKSLEYIKNLSELKHLNLAGCYKITDNGLGNLKGLQSLMSLNLATCTLLTDTGLGFLKDLHNLNDLKLPDFKLN